MQACAVALMTMALGAVSGLLSGCAGISPQSGATETFELSVTTKRARLITRDYADRFAGLIEVTADRIASQTDDREIRKSLLNWKLGGIPAVFSASFRPDPVVSYLDVFALSLFMAEFFETGLGAEALGPFSHEAAAMCRSMWEEGLVISDSVRGNRPPGRTRTALVSWVNKHPVDNWQFEREPLAPQIYAMMSDEAPTLAQAVSTMQERLDDLTAQVTFVNTHLLSHARWQAELFYLEALEDLPADSIRMLMGTTQATFENLNTFTQDFSPLIGRERIAVIRAIQMEREIALATLHSEIAALQSFVQSERIAALNQADQTAVGAVRTAMEELTDLVDMLTIRLALLCLGFGILGGIIGVYIGLRGRRNRSES